MSVIDKLGFGPRREVQEHDNGGAMVMVTAPKMFVPDAKPVFVRLSANQYDGYKRWQAGELIQDAMPSLSPSVREMLMTGLDNESFHKTAG